MPKYIAIHRPSPRRAETDIYGDRLMHDSITVIVEDDRPVPTGLYDSSGVELFRVGDSRPAGFTSRHDD